MQRCAVPMVNGGVGGPQPKSIDLGDLVFQEYNMQYVVSLHVFLHMS